LPLLLTQMAGKWYVFLLCCTLCEKKELLAFFKSRAIGDPRGIEIRHHAV
jgi:hypothetical protein